VVLKDARGDGLTIKKIKASSKWIASEIETKRGNRDCTISLTLDKDALPKGKFNEKIEIRTNYKKPLVVELKGEVL
jgi:hypothetical protein